MPKIWLSLLTVTNNNENMVVAQLAELTLPTPEGMGSNPDISNSYKEHLLTSGTTKMKKRG